MTLKAAVVYVQGSCGNFLARALSLNPDTIPYVNRDLCHQQPNLRLSTLERLAIYSNWHKGWQTAENEICLWYRQGLVDFFLYQNSHLHTIAQFHPAEFCYETDRKLLWQSVEEWQNVILIDWKKSSLKEIISLAERKRPDTSHAQQIINKELDKFQYLKKSLPSAIRVQWEDIVNQNKFLPMIEDLSKKLDIELDLNLVQTFWKRWNDCSFQTKT